MTDLVKVRLQLPGPTDPARGPGWTDVWVREGTSDDDVLREVWIMDAYHARSLPLAYDRHEDFGKRMPLVLDIGACTGLFAVLIAQMYPDARIVAVEPDRENLELLTLNTAKWRDRVDIIPKAVGAHEGTTTLFGSHGTGHTNAIALSDDFGVPVEQITLASLLTEPVALLKLDIESGEYDAIGACPTDALALCDRIHAEWHGESEAPWLDDAPRRYGEMMTKLAYTHSVQVFGSPAAGGYFFAHRQ